MPNQTNAILISIELIRTKRAIRQILDLVRSGIYKREAIGDFIRITFVRHDDAVAIQDLINEMVDELTPDLVMLAIA
jgi:hypothetical protein